MRLGENEKELMIFRIDRLITSKDHASVQIAIADVDENGRALSTATTFALCGQVRSQGESDDSLNRLATKAGCEFPSFTTITGRLLTKCLFFFFPAIGYLVLRNVWSYQK